MANLLRPSRGSPPPNDSLSAVRVAFPQSQDDFDQDPRVSFSRLENKWILEEDDGTEWEFNEVGGRWMPSLSEAQIKRQQDAYKLDGVDENEPTQPQLKRKKADEENGGDGKQQKKSKNGAKPLPERKNTAVYVTSIPVDADEEEVHRVFSRCGVIQEEVDSGKPRVKLYTDDDGKFKGDALIVYFRPESVNLAMDLLDETDFRLGQEGPNGKMRVSEADSSYKKQKDQPATQRKTTDQKKIIKKTQKLNNKLADWSSDEEPQKLGSTSSRFDKVVILKHMFTLEELQADPAALLDIKEDVREECEKLGKVTNVVLFDREEEGIMSVRFGNAEAANACIRLMDGRHFAGQAVEASIATGNERYKKSDEKKVSWDDDDEGHDTAEARRQQQFASWIEGSNNGDEEHDLNPET